MAANGARQRTFQPDAKVRPEAIFELRCRPRKEQPDVVGRKRAVHPGEPLPQMFAIPLHYGEQYLGVSPLELSELDAVRCRAPKHFNSSGMSR